EDAVDHSHPEWRRLPVVAPPKGWDCGTPRAVAAARERLVAQFGAAMPADWPERMGPVVTPRSRLATRQGPGHSPFGGYDMARVAPEESAPARREALVETEPPKQMELAL